MTLFRRKKMNKASFNSSCGYKLLSISDHHGRIHPHAFRRAKATELYRNNTPIELVSAYLGHSSTEVTSIYAIPSPEQIKKSHR